MAKLNPKAQDAAAKQSVEASIFEWIEMVVLSACLILLIFTFVVRPARVDGNSMQDTLHNGEMLIISDIAYKPKRGDILVFQKINSTHPDPIVKRVIATEGQTVDLRDGKVYVDGVALDEPYTDGLPSYPLNTVGTVDISYPYTIPKGDVWVMGDNRTNSSDSRYFGPIDKDTVFGKAFAIYWPVESLAWIG